MKKIINFKKAPQKLLILAMILGTLFTTIGCGKKNNNTNTVATDAPVASTPALPETTEAPIVTPEPTIDPETAKAMDEELIVKQAEEYYARLTSVTSSNFVYPYSYEDVLSIVNVIHGNYEYLSYLPTSDSSEINSPEGLSDFNNLDNAGQNLVLQGLYNRMLVVLIGHVSSVIKAGFEIIEGNKEIKINNPESYKIFEKADETYAKGAETLKLLEDTAQGVYDSLGSDWETFEANALAYQSLIAAIFPERANVWNGFLLTRFTDIDDNMKPFFLVEARGTLAVIANRSQIEGKVITNTENECFTTAYLIDDLQAQNYTITAGDVDENQAECIDTRTNYYSFTTSSKFFKNVRDAFKNLFSKPKTLEYTPKQ